MATFQKRWSIEAIFQKRVSFEFIFPKQSWFNNPCLPQFEKEIPERKSSRDLKRKTARSYFEMDQTSPKTIIKAPQAIAEFETAMKRLTRKQLRPLDRPIVSTPEIGEFKQVCTLDTLLDDIQHTCYQLSLEETTLSVIDLYK